jgi:hypothetical protein
LVNSYESLEFTGMDLMSQTRSLVGYLQSTWHSDPIHNRL